MMKKYALIWCLVLAMTSLAAGTAFAAVRHCDAGTCRGTDVADRIYGTDRAQVFFGQSGDDKIFGRAGDDVVKGDAGNDAVYGQVGNDKVKGSNGRDMVFGGAGDDVVRGGTHDQTNDGTRDILDCGPGVDTVYYTPGTDVLRGCEIRNPPMM